jgi:hypothetical protein
MYQDNVYQDLLAYLLGIVLIIFTPARVTRRVALVEQEQELLILPEHPSSPPVVSGLRVTRS